MPKTNNNPGRTAMIKTKHTLEDAKRFVSENEGRPIRFRYREMRKVYGEYNGVITQRYPMVFVITSSEMGPKESMTFSYPDLICARVEIKAAPPLH